MGPMDQRPMTAAEWALEELRHHWDTAYVISRPEPGTWLAQRRDNRETLRTDDPDALFSAISADYGSNPVPREASQP